eukprot:8642389-Ditylum_brightwellii.AAC.1
MHCHLNKARGEGSIPLDKETSMEGLTLQQLSVQIIPVRMASVSALGIVQILNWRFSAMEKMPVMSISTDNKYSNDIL